MWSRLLSLVFWFNDSKPPPRELDVISGATVAELERERIALVLNAIGF